MKKNFDTNLPIYSQIIDRIKLCIANEKYKPSEKIPSVRDLAVEYGVNPNTMQKSLTKLEEQGLMYTERTSGRYITGDIELISKLKQDIPNSIIDSFVTEMIEAGIERDQILTKIDSFLKGEHNA